MKRFWISSAVVSSVVSVLAAAMLVTPMARADAGSPPDAPAGLVGRWHMDDLSGELTPDSSGFDNNGIVSGMSFVPGKWGNAVRANNSGARVTIANPLQSAPELTVAAWVHKNEDAPGDYQYIVDQGAFGCTAASWALYTGPSSGLEFYVYDGNQAYVSSDAGPALWDDNWHAVAGVFDGHTVSLYVDGQLIGSPQPAPNQAAMQTGSTMLVGDYDNVCDDGGQVDASIDEVHLYDRALDPSEVIALQTGLTPPPPSTTAVFAPAGTTSSMRAVLDARASTGAVRYRWDLNNDGTNDVECGKKDPVLSVKVLRPQTSTIGLTTFASDGQFSTAAESVALTGPVLTKKTVKTTPQVAICGRTPAAVIGGGTACADRLTFGVIEAKGCLTKVTKPGDLGASDQEFLEKFINEFNSSDQMREYVFEYCTALNMGDCHSTSHQIDLSDVADALRVEDFYKADSTVMINGIKFNPEGGHPILLGPQIGRVVSKHASLALGKIPLSDGELNLDVLGDGPIYSSILSHSPSVDLAKALNLGAVPISAVVGAIGGFVPEGNATLKMKRVATQHFTESAFHMRLPETFRFSDGELPSGSASLVADNENGVNLDTIDLKVPSAHLGPALLSDLEFKYSSHGNHEPEPKCASDFWSGTANIYFGDDEDGGGVSMSPAPPKGVMFCGESFAGAGLDWTFPPADRPVLYPGVLLASVGGTINLHPTAISGKLGLSIVDVLDVDGNSVIAFATTNEPYTLTEEIAEYLHVIPLTGRTFKSTTFISGSHIKINVDGTTLDLGDGYSAYSYPNYVAMGSSVHLDEDTIPLVDLQGTFDGEAAIGDPLRFSMHGHVEAQVDGIPGGMEADTWLTSKGMVMCGDHLGTHPGVGYHWGDDLPEVWFPDGCKPSSYWVIDIKPGGRAKTAKAGQTITFDVNSASKGIKLVGDTAAPRVRVIAPDGTSISNATDDFVVNQPLSIMRQPGSKTTFVGVTGGDPGTYKIRLMSGSANVTDTFETGTAAANILASVSGSGDERTLTYTLKDVPGRTVSFFLKGADNYQEIGQAEIGTHSISFPITGSAGPRKIVAETSLDGVVSKPVTVASFKAKVPTKLATPTSLTIKRKGTRVIAHWNAVPWATGYNVVLTSVTGLVKRMHVDGPSATLRGVARWEKGAVDVSAERFGTSDPITGQLKSRFSPPTNFLPYSELTT